MKHLRVVDRIFYSILGLLLLLGSEFVWAQTASERGVKIVPLQIEQIYRDSWAVVIGINRYKNVPRLNYAVRDAQNVATELKKLGFADDKVFVVLDEHATKRRIEEVLYGNLRATKRDDRVFVFFAGHGITASLPRGGEEGYILPIDGDPDNLALTAISMEDVARISRWVPAKHILFAMDACYSGFAITRDIPPSTIDDVYLKAMTREPAVQIITAGRKGEPVLEDNGHGLFTKRMLQGLGGLADVDRNGIITGQELATWLESRVIRDSQNRQHPQYARLSGEGQFVFVNSVRASSQQANGVSGERQQLAREAERLKAERELLEEQRRLQVEREKLFAERLRIEEERKKAEMARLELERYRSQASPANSLPSAGEIKQIPENLPESQIARKVEPAPTLIAVIVQGNKNNIEINGQSRLTVTGRWSDGQEKQVVDGVEWRVSDRSIVDIRPDGTLIGLKSGTVTIGASYGGVESTRITLVVRDAKQSPSSTAPSVQQVDQIINAAKAYRDQGDYSRAISELRKAQAVAPGSKEVAAEINLTRSACQAEQKLGIPVSCN